MSKIKNRIAGNRSKRQAAKQMKAFKDLKEEMQNLVEAEDYVAAMDVMAEIATNGKIDAEVMYWGAMCYFRTGDYERAAKWINNALSYNSRGVKERILLSAVCIADGRYEDGVKIMEMVLSNGIENIAIADREFMLMVMEPVRYGYEDMLERYPKMEAMLKESFEPDAEKAAEESASTALAKLREMLGKKEAGDKIASAVENANEPSVAVQDGSAGDNRNMAEPESPVEEAFDVAGAVQQIMEKSISLQEKIRLLNAFAGGCYQSGDYQAAFGLLGKALELDAYAPEILKNMAYVCLANDDKEKAMEFVSRLPMVDFGLLYAMKKC